MDCKDLSILICKTVLNIKYPCKYKQFEKYRVDQK